MSNKPKSRTLVGKKTEYSFIRIEGKTVKLPRHRVRAFLKVIGRQRPIAKRSLMKNQWDISPMSNEA